MNDQVVLNNGEDFDQKKNSFEYLCYNLPNAKHVDVKKETQIPGRKAKCNESLFELCICIDVFGEVRASSFEQ